MTDSMEEGPIILNCIKLLHRWLGFLTALIAGTILAFAHDWTNREQQLRSYEMVARYLMPRVQGMIASSIDR